MGDLSAHEAEYLILGYEDLEPEDRVVADAYLREHPGWAARLAWHQDRETMAVDPVQNVLPPQAEDELDPMDESAQQESLQRILAGLDLQPKRDVNPSDTRIVSLPDRLRRHGRWLLPLAAALALVILMPNDGGKRTWLQDLSVTRIAIVDDDSRGPDQPALADGILRSGQAFALDFHLDEDAYVVVYHVGPAGQVSRVHPEAIDRAFSISPGGHEYQIPDPDSGETWILGAETGTESFLVAISEDLPRKLDQIQVDPTATDRDRIVADLKAQLTQLTDQVHLREFQHID